MSPAPIPAGSAPTAPLAVGTLLAEGTRYAFEDIGITLTAPAGWRQQLMNDGSVALFSADYPTTGKRDRGAMMLITRYQGTLPTDDRQLATAMRRALGPGAVVEGAPIRLAVGDKQGAQVVARGTDPDGTLYHALYTILQSGGKSAAVRATTAEGLDRYKPLFDAVMESMSFTGGPAAR